MYEVTAWNLSSRLALGTGLSLPLPGPPDRVQTRPKSPRKGMMGPGSPLYLVSTRGRDMSKVPCTFVRTVASHTCSVI